MSAEKNEYIEKTYQQPQTISQDRQRQLEYDAWLKATLDYNQGILEAEQRGRKQGLRQVERERKMAEAAEARAREAEAHAREAEAYAREAEAHAREAEAYAREAEARAREAEAYLRELEQMLEERLQQSAENQLPEIS